MPSPFPGMAPYLEGALWPDVHSALAAKIGQFLAPQVRPRYVVRLAVYLIAESAPDNEIGVLYPDVEVQQPTLDQPLPTMPVPLRPPDADAVLDLQAALAAVYDEAGYDLSIDYARRHRPRFDIRGG